MNTRTPLLLTLLSLSVYAHARSSLKKLTITQLTGNFYLYKTYVTLDGQPFPANGMYLVTNRGAVIFDTPWDSTQFQPLLDSIWARHHQKAVLCIATHFHEDRTAGLSYYRQQGISTYTTLLTDQLSGKNHKKRAEKLMTKDTLFNIGPYGFEVFYPGEGHTPDNIVIWFEKEKILYGGCLIKSTEAADLGNLGDANINTYATTIEKVQQHCPSPAYSIPGHQDWTDKRSLQHTWEMAKQLKMKKK